MKRIVLLAALMMCALGMKAQSCETIMLPFFNGDVDAMNSYPDEKFEWRCAFARAAFYESDVIPTGAEVYSIAQVVNKEDGQSLPENYQVDLTTLSFYAYNFKDLQLQYPKCNVTICFTTPASEHPYLVLRSIDDMYKVADNIVNDKTR
jgi:hypothetical protein